MGDTIFPFDKKYGVSSTYGDREYWLNGQLVKDFHKGVDFLTPMRTPIRMMYDGSVDIYIDSTDAKYLVMIKKGTNFRVDIIHVDEVLVRGPASIGDIVGYTGNSGRLTQGPHAHVEKRDDWINNRGGYSDPQAWLESLPTWSEYQNYQNQQGQQNNTGDKEQVATTGSYPDGLYALSLIARDIFHRGDWTQQASWDEVLKWNPHLWTGNYNIINSGLPIYRPVTKPTPPEVKPEPIKEIITYVITRIAKDGSEQEEMYNLHGNAISHYEEKKNLLLEGESIILSEKSNIKDTVILNSYKKPMSTELEVVKYTVLIYDKKNQKELSRSEFETELEAINSYENTKLAIGENQSLVLFFGSEIKSSYELPSPIQLPPVVATPTFDAEKYQQQSGDIATALGYSATTGLVVGAIITILIFLAPTIAPIVGAITILLTPFVNVLIVIGKKLVAKYLSTI